MTENTTTEVEVTQEARDAVAEYGVTQGWPPRDWRAVQDGYRDMAHLVQAFARFEHRIRTSPPAEVGGLVERLRSKARASSDIHRQMMEAKSLRQESNTERRTDLYYWPKPEETDEWKAADLITSLQSRIAVLEEAGERMAEALREAREVVDATTDLARDCIGKMPKSREAFVRNTERLRKIDTALTHWPTLGRGAEAVKRKVE